MKGEKTLAELAQQFRRAPEPDHETGSGQLAGRRCRGLLIAMCQSASGRASATVDVKTLHAKIGELAS